MARFVHGKVAFQLTIIVFGCAPPIRFPETARIDEATNAPHAQRMAHHFGASSSVVIGTPDFSSIFGLTCDVLFHLRNSCFEGIGPELWDIFLASLSISKTIATNRSTNKDECCKLTRQLKKQCAVVVNLA